MLKTLIGRCIATAILGCSFVHAAESSPEPDAANTTNHPFISKTLYPAWSQMTPQQLAIDAQEAIRRADERIRPLLQLSPQQANFDNSFLAYSRATQELDQLLQYSYHICTVHNIRADFRPTLNQLSPAISNCRNKLYRDARMRNLLQHVQQSAASQHLSPARQRYMRQTLAAMPIQLTPDMEKTRAKMQQELHQLISQYEYNISHTTDNWHYVFTDAAQLKGVPYHTMQAMEQAAQQRGFSTDAKKAWLISPKSPSIRTVLKYATNETTRKKCWQGIKSPGNTRQHDNGPLLLRILQLRHELAKLHGYKCHADYKLRDSMMGNSQNALKLIKTMLNHLKPWAQRQNDELLRLAATYYGHPVQALNPWDVEFFRAQQTQSLNHFNPDQLRPYLEYETCLQGLLKHGAELYGLSIRELPTQVVSPGNTCPPNTVEVWADGVRAFAVHNAADGTHYGSFYLDAYARPGKNTGARCQILNIGTRCPHTGAHTPHLAAMLLNLHQPRQGQPHLLSHLELRMLFHEFGHILHMLIGHGELPDNASVNQALDFVELPALFHENFAWEPSILSRFARHHQTGEPLPAATAQKLAEARYTTATYNTLLSTLYTALIDLEAHTHYNEHFHGKSPDIATRQLLEPWLPPATQTSPSILRNLPHCISIGYDAFFYSYATADVMAADIVELFRQNGLDNSVLGTSYRKTILEPGNSTAPDILYRQFMGRDVSATPFLKNLPQ